VESSLPKGLKSLISFFDRLPGIGPKSAARLALYLFQTPQSFLDEFSAAVGQLKNEVKTCSICFNLDDSDPCRICSSEKRNKNRICVVERVLDVLAIESTGKYTGVYHVLGGVINPLAQVGPEELTVEQLMHKISDNPEIEEIIIATNPTLEGEATAMYLKKKIDEDGKGVLVTRIGHGLPMGADLDYADPGTLVQALEGRRQL
jgi:recombination protein RecR